MDKATETAIRFAVNKVIESRAWSVSEDGILCMYRDGRGNKCVIGHLIDDEHYGQDLEERGACEPEVIDAVFKSGWICDQKQIDLLQTAYDAGSRTGSPPSFDVLIDQCCYPNYTEVKRVLVAMRDDILADNDMPYNPEEQYYNG